MISKAKRLGVLCKYDNHCAYCGEDITLKTMQVDHIISKRNFYIGHRDQSPDYDVGDIRNLNPSCRKCNNFKGGMTVEELRVEIEKQPKRARKTSVNFRMAEKFGLIKVVEKPVIFHFERQGAQGST